MSDYTQKIINYIDNNLSKKEADKFIIKIENNKELKDEFLLIKEMNVYMNGKLISENIEADNDYKSIEKETREDVSVFLNSEKDDIEVLEYLSFAFPERDIAMTKKLQEIDKDTKAKGIDKITEDWISDEDEKDSDLLKFINSTFEEKENQTRKISFTKNTNNFIKRKDIGRRRLYFWTASVAAIIILLLMLNNIFDISPANEKIFADYHTQPQELMSIRVRNSEQDLKNAFNDALELYKQEKYNKAYVAFQSLETEEKTFVQAYYYSGLCQFEANKFNESIQIFNKVISDYDEYELESKWFIALAYIKINKMQEALPFLNNLSKQKSIYQEDAKEIIKQIKN